MSLPDQIGGQRHCVLSLLSLLLSVCFQTCEHDVLKTDEPISMQIGASGVPWPVAGNCQLLGSARWSKLRGTEIGRKHPFSQPVWLSGNTLVLSNVATLCLARLVPRWVTVFGRANHFGTEPGHQVCSA